MAPSGSLLVNVIMVYLAFCRVRPDSVERERILPASLPPCIRILSYQGIPKLRLAVPVRRGSLLPFVCFLKMGAQFFA
ncbi:hypothetical protein [Thermodesulforhabdus norvegica]|uniref:hypothetical protein n=1 Tax=Thermodesulforhabdus norvegica TaxID=39841 RepID=UPI000B80E78D|nr:hypothetical protein [Thermodesulforhabdus norvegica]